MKYLAYILIVNLILSAAEKFGWIIIDFKWFLIGIVAMVSLAIIDLLPKRKKVK